MYVCFGLVFWFYMIFFLRDVESYLFYEFREIDRLMFVFDLCILSKFLKYIFRLSVRVKIESYS